MKTKTKFKQTEIGVIPNDWEVKKLGEVTNQIFSGGTPDTRKPEYWDENIPWLSSGETGNRFIRNTERKITELGVKNSSTRLAKMGDVIIASAGQGYTRGQASFCMIDTYINQSIVALRAKKEKLKPLFLFYNLLSRYPELRNISDAHSSRGSLTIRILADLNIQIPSIKEQEEISNILFSTDSKIELNQQMNKTLEAIGKAIFKHWFVDFEFLNEEGKPYKSSGGEMIGSELGKIPKGWNVGEFNEIIQLTMGLSPKGESYNIVGEGVPLINGAADFSNNIILPKKFTTQPTRVCKKDDLLFCIRGTIGNLTYADKSYCLGRGVASITATNEIYNEYVYFTLSHELNYMISKAAGSVIVGLSKPDILNLNIILPPENIIRKFHLQLEHIFMKKEMIKAENYNLSQIRDSLLPKLMSGKIRVPVEVRK